MRVLLLGGVLAVAGQARADVFAHPQTATQLSASLLAAPVKEIAHTRVLRGRFVHTKYLHDIPAPLEAKGEFVFLRDKGLYWHTLTPFESVFVLTPNAMMQQDEGGKPTTLDAAAQPAVRAAAAIFMALFSVDLNALDKEFALFGEPAGTGWQLGLRPKNKAMSAVFSQGIVSGAAQVHEVELRDAQGDRTVIRLSATELLDREPTPQELALLAPR